MKRKRTTGSSGPSLAARTKRKRVSQLARGRMEKVELEEEVEKENLTREQLMARLALLEQNIARSCKKSHLYDLFLREAEQKGRVRDVLLASIVKRSADATSSSTSETLTAVLANVADHAKVLGVMYEHVEGLRIAQRNQLRHVQKLTVQVDKFTRTHLYHGPANQTPRVPGASEPRALVPVCNDGTRSRKALVLQSATFVRNGAKRVIVQSLDGTRESASRPSLGDTLLMTSPARIHWHPADTSTARQYERNAAQQQHGAEQKRIQYEARLGAMQRADKYGIAAAPGV